MSQLELDAVSLRQQGRLHDMKQPKNKLGKNKAGAKANFCARTRGVSSITKSSP